MEKLFLRKSIFILSSSLLTACSGVQSPDISGIDSNTVITSSFSTYSENTISGSGKVRFLNPLAVDSSKSFALKASLDGSIGLSSITIMMYSANSLLPEDNGIAIKLSRSGASVTATISYNGNSASVNNSKLVYYFPTSLDLVIDVHNVNSQARVLIWRRDMIEYSPVTADVDTERDGDLTTTLPIQKGGGSYSGLIIQNATVTAARLDSQKILN